MIIHPTLFFFFDLKECNISCKTKMLSCVLLPLMKLDWVGAMIDGIIFFNLNVTHFVTNLYMTLHKEMGLNSEINAGLGTFGMRHK